MGRHGRCTGGSNRGGTMRSCAHLIVVLFVLAGCGGEYSTPRGDGGPRGDGSTGEDCPTDCDDGIYCNGAEVCLRGACVPGALPACDDGDPCTVDACAE